MHQSDIRNRVRECPNCRRIVRLNRNDQYRHHYATEPDGRLHLCAASGQTPAGVVPHALRSLNL